MMLGRNFQELSIFKGSKGRLVPDNETLWPSPRCSASSDEGTLQSCCGICAALPQHDTFGDLWVVLWSLSQYTSWEHLPAVVSPVDAVTERRLCCAWLVPARVQGRLRFLELCLNRGESVGVDPARRKAAWCLQIWVCFGGEKMFMRCHAWDDTRVTHALQAGCPGRE